ncbi:hypothetical protein J2W21_001393 [Sinomonas atrocyanea]|uniref:hypothetical protein n=1 Tax=Sinomonas atrocyanea TaxID=37927 RepID=UPI0027883CAB|nr:hypothetical protein [Sinomonas atrocyanea]MDP9883899.1 hypothetical protein [Sinomonas atrocyanea]
MTSDHDVSRDNDGASTRGPEEPDIRRSGAEAEQSRAASGSTGKAEQLRESVTARARSAAAVILVVLTGALSFAAVPALYLRNDVLDTDRYTAIVAPLATDPAVQAEISDKVTAQITGAIDIEGITRDAMAELGNAAPRAAAAIAGFAPAIAEQTRTLIHATVSNFVASPQFEDLWIQANRVAHEGIVNLARGDTGGAVSIDEGGTPFRAKSPHAVSRIGLRTPRNLPLAPSDQEH